MFVFRTKAERDFSCVPSLKVPESPTPVLLADSQELRLVARNTNLDDLDDRPATNDAEAINLANDAYSANRAHQFLHVDPSRDDRHNVRRHRLQPSGARPVELRP